MFGSDKIVEATECGTFVVVRSSDLYDINFCGRRTSHFEREKIVLTALVKASTSGYMDVLPYVRELAPRGEYFVGVRTISLFRDKPEWFAGILNQFELQQRTDKPEDRIAHKGFMTIAKFLWYRKIRTYKAQAKKIEEGKKLSIVCERDLDL